MRIEKPGIYAIPDAEYFADPCPKPSLTQTIAKLMLDRSPLHGWQEHPRLNANWKPDADDKFTIGTVAHALLFGPGRPLYLLDVDSYRTKAARDERDAAVLAGKIPVKVQDYERAKSMVEAFKRSIELLELEGGCEQTAIAEAGGTWLRTKIDWLSADKTLIVDYKTTSQKIIRDAIPAYAWRSGWHIQAAMQEHILNLLNPARIGRREHCFVLQENYEPWATYKCRISESTLEAGRHQIRKAIDLWRLCLKQNKWPGPSDDLVNVSPPGWAVHEALQGDDSVGG